MLFFLILLKSIPTDLHRIDSCIRQSLQDVTDLHELGIEEIHRQAPRSGATSYFRCSRRDISVWRFFPSDMLAFVTLYRNMREHDKNQSIIIRYLANSPCSFWCRALTYSALQRRVRCRQDRSHEADPAVPRCDDKQTLGSGADDTAVLSAARGIR